MRKWTIRLLAAGVVGGAAMWYLFGWSTTDDPDLGIVRQHRFLGRTTEVAADTNHDGKVDFRAAYRWSDPYQGIVDGPCGDRHVVLSEDRNYDGRWDTWVERAGFSADGTCLSLWSADTTGDESPDWQRQAPYRESQDVYAALYQERGF